MRPRLEPLSSSSKPTTLTLRVMPGVFGFAYATPSVGPPTTAVILSVVYLTTDVDNDKRLCTTRRERSSLRSWQEQTLHEKNRSIRPCLYQLRAWRNSCRTTGSLHFLH